MGEKVFTLQLCAILPQGGYDQLPQEARDLIDEVKRTVGRLNKEPSWRMEARDGKLGKRLLGPWEVWFANPGKKPLPLTRWQHGTMTLVRGKKGNNLDLDSGDILKIAVIKDDKDVLILRGTMGGGGGGIAYFPAILRNVDNSRECLGGVIMYHGGSVRAGQIIMSRAPLDREDILGIEETGIYFVSPGGRFRKPKDTEHGD
jgi:hypothetical protein